MHELTWLLTSVTSTRDLAEIVARRVRFGDVIGLKGEMGVGKTTFARYFISAKGGGEEVPSPTFSLVQTYEVRCGSIWHFDLYRIKSVDEVHELGIEDAFAEGISLIEWPERMTGHLPRDWLEIMFTWELGTPIRRASMVGHGGWCERLSNL